MPALPEDPEAVTREFYRHAAVIDEYDATRFESAGGRALHALQAKAIRDVLGEADLRGASALDLGSGSGRFTALLGSMGAAVVALDSSPGMLARTRSRWPAADTVLGDALRLPFPDASFDVSISVWVLNHLHAHDQAIAELCRVTRGQVVLGLPNLKSAYFLPQLIRSRGLGSLAYTVRRYEMVEAPASFYFRLDELQRTFAASGFRVTAAETRCLLPLVPSRLAGIYPRLEAALRPLFRANGCFLAVAATRA